ncbi:MAG: hypothetical protein FJ152_05155 [Firmicutes bacterium]|nr:hypothetical protein [Bacillota bacterium]
MNWLYLVLAFLAGTAMGTLFFGGLWWTVQKMTGARKPYLLSLTSFLIRTTVILFCFYLLLQSGWYNLFAALFGFLLARTVVTYKLNPAGKKSRHHKA